MTDACGRLSAGYDGCRISLDELVPTVGIRDVTEDVHERLLPSVPKGSQVTKVSACVVGGQGSGKTELIKFVYSKACEKYGKENINCVNCDDIRVAYDMLNDRSVQLFFIDDAMTNASSREVYKQTDILKIYNRGRHEFEAKLNGRPGVIIYVWAWQRFGELDPGFRQSDVTVFKTGIAEASEKKIIEGFIGPFYTRYLWTIWDRMNRGNNEVKSTSVARINSRGIGNGVGKYVTERVNVPDFPEMIRGEDYFGAVEENVDILETYRDKPEWEKRIRCYEMYIEGGRTQKQIAEALGISRQGYVSESVRKVKELLKSK